MKRTCDTVDWVGIKKMHLFSGEDRKQTVCNLLEELTKNLKAALFIPEILENPQIICLCLMNTKYIHVMQIINDFLIDKEKCPPKEIPAHLDNVTNRLIDYFLNNAGILEYLPKEIRHLNSNLLKLFNYLEIITEIAKNHLSESASAAMERELRSNRELDKNADLKKDMQIIEKRREKKVQQSGPLEKKVNGTIQLPLLNDVQAKIITYSLETSRIRQLHAVLEKDLEEKLKAEKNEYEKRIREDLSVEKRKRAEMNKLLLQVEDMYKRYDQTMLRKFIQDVMLTAEYERLEKEANAIQIEFNRVEKIYNAHADRAKERKRQERIVWLVRTMESWYKKVLRARKKQAKLQTSRNDRKQPNETTIRAKMLRKLKKK